MTLILAQTDLSTMKSSTPARPAEIDLYSYAEGREGNTTLWEIHERGAGQLHRSVVRWNPSEQGVKVGDRYFAGTVESWRQVTVRQTRYLLVNDEGKLLSKWRGRHYWSLPLWQQATPGREAGSPIYNKVDTLTPLNWLTERTARRHQQEQGGRIVRLTFGRDELTTAPLAVEWV